MNEKYPKLTKKKLIEIITEVFNEQDKNEEVFYINEGIGFIPFEKSKTFSKIMKEKYGGHRLIEQDVLHAYLFPNNNVVAFDFSGDQIPELQDVYSVELHKKIMARSSKYTSWDGFPKLKT